MAILVVGPNWIGDMVMAQSLLIRLKQLHPEIPIDLLGPSWSISIAGRMPEVRTTIVTDLEHGKLQIKQRKQIARQLRGQYTQAIVLPMSLKSALIPWFAKIPIRTGWRGEMRYKLINDMHILNKNAYPLMVQRYLELANSNQSASLDKEDIPYPKLNIDTQNAQQLCIEHHIDTDKGKILAICPGAAYGPSKRWPVHHWHSLIQTEIEKGWQVHIFGSKGEVEISEEILKGLSKSQKKHIHNFTGKLSLTDTLDILSCAKVVVTNDSGLMHMAASIDKSLVVIYGATPTSYTPPLTKNAEILHTQLSCQPCRKKTCHFGHYNCLENINVEQVDAAIYRLSAKYTS